MSPNKKNGRKGSASPNIPPSDKFKPLFEDMFIDSINIKVDPIACIPFTNIREPTKASIDRFVHNFKQQSKRDDDIINSGYVVGSKMSLVVPLVGTLFNNVIEYLKLSLQVEKPATERAARQHKKWYSIVDGLCNNLAIRKLRLINSSWSDFHWYVCVIKGFILLKDIDN